MRQEPVHFIYFDVNKTIMMSDAVANKSEHDVINAILAENVSELFYDWDHSGERISYYHYTTKLGKQRFPKDYHERKEYRNLLVHQFIEFLHKKCPQLLPQAEVHYETLHKALNRRQHGKLVWSFSRFIHSVLPFWQENPALNSKIIFRTFGQDIDQIEASMRECLTDIDFTLERLTFTASGDFDYRNNLYRREEFGDILRNKVKPRFIAVADSYEFWRNQHFVTTAGKPLPVFEGRSFSPFFDDNIRGSHDSLAKRDIIFPYWERDKKGILPRDLIGSQLIKVNPFCVLTDENYFLNEYNAACHQSKMPEYLLKQN